jgi:dolichyl-phosphate beta-glucosyltransferase
MEISVVVPAYNEESRIEASLRVIDTYLSGREHEIIVVDDSSVDDTVDTLNKLAAQIPSLKIIGHRPNRGKGYTVRQGVLEASGKLILMSDADLAAPIEELPKLEAAIKGGSGLAVGSREGAGAVREVHQSFLREVGGRGAQQDYSGFGRAGNP